MIVDVKQPILLIANEDQIEEAITRLSRVGFDNVLGYLNGGIDAWTAARKETDCIQTIDAEAFAGVLKSTPEALVVDVRKDGEYASEHVENAIHASLEFLPNNLHLIPKEAPFYLHCAGGYRSLIAHSVLKAKGYHNAIDVLGGFKAICCHRRSTDGLRVSKHIVNHRQSNAGCLAWARRSTNRVNSLRSFSNFAAHPRVAKLVDAQSSGGCAFGRVGSSPVPGTFKQPHPLGWGFVASTGRNSIMFNSFYFSRRCIFKAWCKVNTSRHAA